MSNGDKEEGEQKNCDANHGTSLGGRGVGVGMRGMLK